MDSGLRRNDEGNEAGLHFRQVHSVVWALIIGRSGRPGRDLLYRDGDRRFRKHGCQALKIALQFISAATLLTISVLSLKCDTNHCILLHYYNCG